MKYDFYRVTGDLIHVYEHHNPNVILTVTVQEVLRAYMDALEHEEYFNELLSEVENPKHNKLAQKLYNNHKSILKKK